MTARWLVTGCSSGLGEALAVAAVQAGAQVVATARKTASLDDLVKAWPGRISPVALDVRDAEQCEEAVRIAAERMGGIDVLVNNAGAGVFGAVEEIGDEELRDQLETLLVGPWRMARLVLPLMRAQGSGHIVNVSSLAGRTAFPGLGAYVAAKHALEGMSQTLAAETAPLGIRVTVMEPAGYATRYGTAMARSAVELSAYSANEGMLGMLRGMADNPDLGRPEDFARTVVRLVSAEPPTPLRVPVGPGAHELLSATAGAAQAELEAARSLTGHTEDGGA